MKIAFVVDALAAAGGAEEYLRNLSSYLVRRGDRITLVSANPREAQEWEVCRVLVTARGRGARLRAFARGAEEALARGGFDVSLAVRHAVRADVFQPHGGIVAAGRDARAKARRFPTVRRFGAWAPRQRAMEAIEREILQRCTVIAAVSRKVAAEIETHHPEAAGKVRLLPIGIDLDRFRPEGTRIDLRGRFGIEAGAPLLLFVAFHPRLKGWESALGLLRSLPGGTHLIACGFEPERVPRSRHWRHLRSRVHLLGPTARMAEVYRSVDLLVHPTFYDPCSLVVLEALACGLPALTTRCNGAAEVGGEALRGDCEPDDVAGLTRDALHLLQNRDRLRASARDSVKARAQDDHFAQLRNLLQECRRNAGEDPRGAEKHPDSLSQLGR